MTDPLASAPGPGAEHPDRPGPLVRGVRGWRRSLQRRVVATTLLVALVGVAAVGSYLSTQIRDGLVEQRRVQALEESARASARAQATFAASPAVTGSQVQSVLYELVQALLAGPGEKDVLLLRSPGPQTIFVNDVSTADPGLVPPELRQAVRASTAQQWTFVGVPTEPGEALVPGLIIGSAVDVPAAGSYELYFLYDLSAEQSTLVLIQRVLLVAGSGLLVFLVGMTWLVTRQVVQPVRRAARVAERLADGHLAERMTVRGVDEMATLAASFNEMAESLQDQIVRMEELSRLQRRFVSDVSHELRTPLTTIRMATEVLHGVKDEMDAPARRSAELLRTQLDRFEALLADLLEISRFDAGAAMLDAESRDVRDVVTSTVEHAAPLAERRGVWLSVTLPGNPVVADIDPRRVERVLRNLLVNAIEHGEGRPVRIRVAADDHAVAVTVRDHGVGMDPDEVQHVFDRFWRADPARARSTGGTGLGLAISVEDAHLHGGWLEAWGRPGQGACFRLTLPLRAGIGLRGSPLPLEPADDAPVAPVPAPPEDPVATDPAALPDLDRMEAS